jgi:hypothetical protein
MPVNPINAPRALNIAEIALHGFTHAIKIVPADLATQTTAATPLVIEMVPVKAGDVVIRAAYHLRTPFAASGDAAFNSTTITIGDGNGAATYLASTQINVNGTEILNKAGTGTEGAYDAADTVDITFTSMAAKALASLNVGELWVFLHIANVKELAGACSLIPVS